MAEADFSQLLQQAEQLTTEIEGNEELPRVERSLGQVLEASQELYSKVIKTGAHDIQANLLLGSKGIDLQQISNKLETLSSKRTFEPLQPIADSDVESYLKNEKENAILSLIEEVNKNAMQITEDQKWEHMLSEWNQEKITLMNAMIGPSQNWLDLKKTPEPIFDSSSYEPPMKFGQSMLDNVEAAYARQVRQHNKAIFQGSKSTTPLYQVFGQVAEELNDPKVKEMWEILKSMANIPSISRVNLIDQCPLKARSEPAIQQCLIAQGKKYLENRAIALSTEAWSSPNSRLLLAGYCSSASAKRHRKLGLLHTSEDRAMYKVYMSDVVRTSRGAAARGGQPGTYPLVLGYVGLRTQSGGAHGLLDGTLDDRPLWPLVYYCLRAGDATAALHCLNKAGRDNDELTTALEEYMKNPEQPLSDKVQNAINFQYRIQVRNSTDPFKRAVYCVVGNCDVSDEHPEVARTADDYLWLKLALIKARPSADADAFTYSDLQKMILEEYGETHYNAHEKPVVYFQVLALTGQFEPAIEFLSRIPRYRVHALHMALALHDLYLLGTPRNVQAPLLSVDIEDPVPLRRLNLARLILLYVRKFELTDPLDALHYYFFMRNLMDPSGKNLFMCCATDLILDSRDYELFWGRVEPVSGLRSAGLLDQFNTANIDSRVIAIYVAEQLVSKGLLEDAINVYDIAGELEQMVEQLCVLVGQVVEGGVGAGGSALQRRLPALLEHAATRLRCGDAQLPAPLHHAYTALTHLLDFFELFHAENYDAALEKLSESGVVPVGRAQLEPALAASRRARGCLLRCVPAVLRAACTILHARRKRLPSPHLAASPASSKQLEWLREQAEVLNTFAGNIPYRMPADTYSALAQLQIVMQ